MLHVISYLVLYQWLQKGVLRLKFRKGKEGLADIQKLRQKNNRQIMAPCIPRELHKTCTCMSKL